MGCPKAPETMATRARNSLPWSRLAWLQAETRETQTEETGTVESHQATGKGNRHDPRTHLNERLAFRM